MARMPNAVYLFTVPQTQKGERPHVRVIVAKGKSTAILVALMAMPSALATADDLGAWVENALAVGDPAALPARVRSLDARMATPVTGEVRAESRFEAGWARTSALGRRAGERYRQDADTTFSTDYGNGLASEIAVSFRTRRGTNKGEDDDTFGAQSKVSLDVLGMGGSSRLSAIAREAQAEARADRGDAREKLEEIRLEFASSLVGYVRLACLQRAFERARARTDDLLARTQALRKAGAAGEGDELAVVALRSEASAKLEMASAELQEVTPLVAAQGEGVRRIVGDAAFEREAFCQPIDVFEVPRAHEDVLEARRVEAAEASRASRLSTLAAERARLRPVLGPFVGFGWEQEGGQAATPQSVVGVRLEARLGGVDPLLPASDAVEVARLEADLARERGAASLASQTVLWRRRVRAFDAARRSHEARVALRENLEAQWRAGAVSTGDFTKAWVDAADAYEDLLEAWSEAIVLKLRAGSAQGSPANTSAPKPAQSEP